MKNKMELKKMILLSTIIVIIFWLFSLFISYKEYNDYTLNFNKKINLILNEVKQKYPDVNINNIIKILNENTSNDEEILRMYGINMQSDSAIYQNNNNYHMYIIIKTIMIIIFSLILILVFLKYNYKKDKKIKEITKYLYEINKGNYKLYIEDNSEDELSILKNELYKTTIMLKETAENSLTDKINLKESLSDISHQLKTPLTSILIILDNILEDKNMNIKVKEDFIKDIKREIINIQFLVQSILKLSKLDSNSVTFIKKDVTINEILNEAIKNVEILCDLKNINICKDGKNIEKINCDFKWQVEAITNILKNCVEHSYENSEIKIRFEDNKIYSKIEIIDNGTGIDKEDLPHIFERFYKGKNSTSESVGIGLSLSKTIIEKSNGYIEVESKIRKGTKFIIKYLK